MTKATAERFTSTLNTIDEVLEDRPPTPGYVGRHRRVPLWKAADLWSDAWSLLLFRVINGDEKAVAVGHALLNGPVARHIYVTRRTA